MDFLAPVRETLDAFDPRAWPIVIAIVVIGSTETLKRYAAPIWKRLPQTLQGLPAVLVSLAAIGATGVEFQTAIVDAVYTAVFSIGGYHTLKRVPGVQRALKSGAATSLSVFIVAFAVTVALSCTPEARDRARTVDDLAEQACELLSTAEAERLGVDPQAIIDAACGTRAILDELLSVPAREAVKAGIAPPDA